MSSTVNQMVNTNNEFNQALAKQKGSALDKDAFMLLLVTQFKYQDPLNPMEDKEFIAQLAQFSSLEQLMNLNDSMGGLTQATQEAQMINATSYIGKTVDATGDKVSKTTDKDGKVTISSFRYAIGEAAVQGSISIFDAATGQLVNSYSMPARTPGTYTFDSWDGTGIAGSAVPDGIYRIVPQFTNAEGKPITDYDAVVDGKVNGVINENGTTYLTLEDGRNVALASVRRVGEPKTVEKPAEKPEEKPEEKPDEKPPVDGGGDGGTDGGDGTGGAGDGAGDGTGGDTGGSGTETAKAA